MLSRLSHPPMLLMLTALCTTSLWAKGPALGVNIVSVGNQYQDATYREPLLTPFMDQLKAAGMERLSVRVTWSTMEPQPGVLNQTYLSNLERVITAAGTRGMKVLLDFHTLFNTGCYACPKWVAAERGDDGRDGIASVVMAARSRKIRDRYLAMVRAVVTQARTWPGVDAVSVMNEPWSLDWKDAAAKQVEHRLIEDWANETSAAVKQVAPQMKRTLRFTAAINPWADDPGKRFDWDRLAPHFDFFSVNAYANPVEKPEAAALIARVAARCRAEGRDLWITEFGRETVTTAEHGPGSPEIQEAYYKDYLSWLGSCPDAPSVALAWVIQPGGKEAFNLYNPTNKVFHPAWKVLGK